MTAAFALRVAEHRKFAVTVKHNAPVAISPATGVFVALGIKVLAARVPTAVETLNASWMKMVTLVLAHRAALKRKRVALT